MHNYHNSQNFSKLNDGLSGILRVKNEGSLIEACIDSCINSLDELIAVYTGCTDDTESILLRKVKQYPNKLKVYKYPYDISWFDLSTEEYDRLQSLPDDSPLLYCNLCNYALSKVRYKYAVKIDADQLYFADKIEEWRDVCKSPKSIKWGADLILGSLFKVYFSLYRRLSVIIGKPMISMLPKWMFDFWGPKYIKLAKWNLVHNKAAIALSGINLFKDTEWYIPFDKYNTHPPYNGEGDTLIFKVTDEVFYSRVKSRQTPNAVIEVFNQHLPIMFAGPVWFHLHANRAHCWGKVKQVKESHPNLFIPINEFSSMTYKQVLHLIDKNYTPLYQRILFILVHYIDQNALKGHLYLLKTN